jgi:cytochrome c oxidase cbb3-type subunit 4
MDLNDGRAILTLLGFVGFVLIVVWAYSKAARKGFKEAADLPFADDDLAKRSGEQGKDK